PAEAPFRSTVVAGEHLERSKRSDALSRPLGEPPLHWHSSVDYSDHCPQPSYPWSPTMKPPRCSVFPPSTRYPHKVVRALHYDGEALVLDIQGEAFSFARVIFRDPVGFRVLDERDLCEFWNAYSEPNGWLYEVHEGGWLELERKRELFNSRDFFPGLREYL